jgi:hypothetical protein
MCNERQLFARPAEAVRKLRRRDTENFGHLLRASMVVNVAYRERNALARARFECQTEVYELA